MSFVKTFFKNALHRAIFFLCICLVIGFMLLIGEGGNFVAYAQQPMGGLTSLLTASCFGVPFPFCGMPFYGIPFPSIMPFFPPPAIRQPAFGGVWPELGWNRGNFRPALPAPAPVFRRAATTVTILISNGPTAALLVINPTALYGQSVPLIIPTAPTLPALFSGKPLIFGSTPITSSNVQILNYIANTFLLPTGIAFYILP